MFGCMLLCHVPWGSGGGVLECTCELGGYVGLARSVLCHYPTRIHHRQRDVFYCIRKSDPLPGPRSPIHQGPFLVRKTRESFQHEGQHIFVYRVSGFIERCWAARACFSPIVDICLNKRPCYGAVSIGDAPSGHHLCIAHVASIPRGWDSPHGHHGLRSMDLTD